MSKKKPTTTKKATTEFVLPAENYAPRCEAERYRVYALDGENALHLRATCGSKSGIGMVVATMGAEGEWELCALGVLDTHGSEDEPGTWLVNPWDARVQQSATQDFEQATA